MKNPTITRKVSCALLSFALCANGFAATTDLSSVPLVTSSSASVLPNLMYVLDDSGSMDWDFLPDRALNFSGKYGYNSAQCNGVYYDPTITYVPPVDSTGTNFSSTATTFTAALRSGYNTGAGTVDLSTSFSGGSGTGSSGINLGSVPAFYYTYTGTQTTQALKNYFNTASTFYTECNSAIGVAPGNAVFTKVVVGNTSGPGGTDERTNFANWYTYYSTRMLMMKTSSGIAFKPINDKYRVGFLTINNNISPDIVENAPFDATQKSAWYSKLYAATPGNSTPLRQSLANVGQYYAHKFGNVTNYVATITVGGSGSTTVSSIQVAGTETMAGTSTASTSTSTVAANVTNQINILDPSNYGATVAGNTITITGPPAANGSTPVIIKSGSMTFTATAFNPVISVAQLNNVTPADPVQYSCQQNFVILSTDGYWNGNNGTRLNGAPIGNQDDTEIRPMNDGSLATYTITTPTDTVVRKQTGQPIKTVKTWSRNVTTVSASPNCVVPVVGVHTGTCLQDNAQNSSGAARTWCMSALSSPGNSSQCSGGMGTVSQVYACRGVGNPTNTPNAPDNTGCVTDGAGANWCIYSGSATPGTSSCTQVLASNTLYACKAPAGASNGYTVTTQVQTSPETILGTTTTVDDVTTSTSSQVTYTNSLAGPAVVSTVGTATTNVSNTTAVTSDTGPGTWSNSGGSVNSCVSPAPAAGTSAAVLSGTTTTNTGSATVTTLSTTTTSGAPVTSPTSTTGGVSDTLADVAEYYYVTDLRDSSLGNQIGALGTDVSLNDVPSSGLDGASWQHMTTFTLGLGARGRMVFSPTYLSDSSGDFFAVKQGSAANPPTICSWQAAGSGACNWPTPGAGQVENIDDLWHAAVNGRGTYFSATNPATLSSAITSALAGVSARTGASAAATTSNPNVTSGDNFVFSSTFTTQEWDGELVRQQLDLTIGVTLPTIDWAAQGQLDVNASRNIYTFSSGASNKLRVFTWANLTGVEQAYFNMPAISTAGTGLTQFLCASPSICLSGASQTAAAGSNLVSFLGGDRTNEGIAIDNTKYYRQRLHLLGDIVNAEAVYVKASLSGYADFNHSAFVTSVASRQGMVYVAANDGMLHAFYAADGGPGIVGGAEAWAYIPTSVLPSLYKLADKNYTSKHQYYVDGTPVASEICISNCNNASAVWKSILVGGLNGGGQGYYALDITDPLMPKALWEFTDANMGYTYGNPVVTKLNDGTWVVLVTSGYNNVNTGDGVGRLYVINATTGALIRTLSTGVGSVATPSGLGKISAVVLNPTTDNTMQQVYGGDMLGNLWRFDVNGNLGPAGYEAQLLVTLKNASNQVQPLTSKQEVGLVNGHIVVYVGTGRYLGATDLADTSQQSLYAIRDDVCFTDPLSPQACSATELARVPGISVYNNPRSDLNFVHQIQTNTTCPAGTPATICTIGQQVRTSSNYPVDMGVNFGWYVDLLGTGERANTDPVLALGTLGYTTNVPNTSACTVGGISFRYFIDFRTGGPVSSSPTGVVGTKLGNALATRPVYVRLPNNTIVELTRLSDGTTVTSNVPIGASGLPTRRTSWRELTE